MAEDDLPKIPGTPRLNRRWLLARRPQGLVSADDFRLEEAFAPRPGEGEFLVRNVYLSCDPTQRGWMAGNTYLPPVRIGEVMRSLAVGKVLESNTSSFAVGQWVQGFFGWQDYAVARPGGSCPPIAVPPGANLESAMGVLGYTGWAAYFGLLEVGRPRAGETVVVSAAAGATGAVVGQIAKIKGCRAIGIAGGAEKCGYLTAELGFDAAIDYKSENVVSRLRETCPRGIDVFFDNVGGRILDAALVNLALRGRIVVCGAISTYNEDTPALGPKNHLKLLVQRGRMEGFLVLDYLERVDEAIAALSGWVREGKIKERVDVQRGLENAPSALARLFQGENRGKQLLLIADPGASG